MTKASQSNHRLAPHTCVATTPVAMFLLIELACYFLYPAWRHTDSSAPIAFSILFAHAVVLFLLLYWWQRPLKDEQPAVFAEAWSWTVFRTAPGVLLILTLVAIALVQIPLTHLPFRSSDDESVMVHRQIDQYLALTKYLVSYGIFSKAVLGLCVSVVGMFIVPLIAMRRWRRTDDGLPLPDRLKQPTGPLSLGCLMLVFTAGYYLLSGKVAAFGWGSQIRWPPVGTLLGVAIHGAFGFDEFAARLPALLFYLGTGVYVFRITAPYLPRYLAIIPAVLTLTTPVLFQFGHIASRETGGVFFVTAGIFYLVRHVRFGSVQDLGIASAMVVLGYLERRPAAIFLFVIIATIILAYVYPSFRKRKISLKGGIRLYAGAITIVVWTVLPWSTISREIRPYHFHIENWTDWSLVTAYARMLPAALGWPVTALAVIGIVVALVRRRLTETVAFILFALFYVLFTSDEPYWIPVRRFTTNMCVPVVLIGVGTIGAIRSHVRATAVGIVVLMIGLCPAASWYRGTPILFSVPEGSPTIADEPYYPVDQAVHWLTQNTDKETTVAPPVYWQSPLHTYLTIQHYEGISIYIPPWIPSPRFADATSLAKMCRDQQIDYLMIPIENGKQLFTDLRFEQGGGFRQVASFTLGQKQIVLCELRHGAE